MMRFVRACGLVLFVTAIASAPAQTPVSTSFTYQGRLDLGGQPANGQFALDFQLFDAATTPPGTQLGTTISLNVPVASGVFTVQLNDAGQFGPSAFDGQARFLEIAVNSTPLSPRQPLSIAPYAEFARAATALHGDGSATNAAFIDQFGSLVLGTGSNLQKLDSGGVARSLLLYDGSDNLQLLAPPDKTMAFRTGTGGFTSVRATLTANGRLGIGTAAPDTLVHILNGDVGATGTITASNLLLERTSDNFLTFMSPANRTTGLAFGRPGNTATELFHGAIVYNEAALPDAMQFRTGGNFTRMTITDSGRVGIGTTAPIDPLHIVDVQDATIRLERTGGAHVMASAQSSVGEIGTTNAFPFRLLTNSTIRVVVSSAGNVGINTATPTGRLHVLDTTGGNTSVVLPNSSISAAEMLDEPGCAGLVFATDPFEDDPPLPAFFPDPPASMLAQSINAPAAGYVLAIATVGARSFSTGGTAARWGLTTDVDDIPDDQMLLVEFNPTSTAGNWSTPVTIHRLIPVSAGTTTVHVVAQGIFGNWEYEKAQLSLVFIPTTYGAAPLTDGDGRPDAQPGPEPGAAAADSSDSPVSATVSAENSETMRLLEELRAERAALAEDIQTLRALRSELRQPRLESQETP